jgi:hypothetical protein
MIALRPSVSGSLIGVVVVAGVALAAAHARHPHRPSHQTPPPTPPAISINATISDHTRILASPFLLALDGERASVEVGGPADRIVLGVTAHAEAGRIVLDVSYAEQAGPQDHPRTTRAASTRVIVADRHPVTLDLADRWIVITPARTTPMGAPAR